MNSIISAVVAFVVSIIPVGHTVPKSSDVTVYTYDIPVNISVTFAPTPYRKDSPKPATKQNDEKKIGAYNTASGKEMPTTVSEKAVEKSPVLIPLPTPMPEVKVIPTSTPIPIPIDPWEPVIDIPPNIDPSIKKGKIDPIIVIPPPRLDNHIDPPAI